MRIGLVERVILYIVIWVLIIVCHAVSVIDYITHVRVFCIWSTIFHSKKKPVHWEKKYVLSIISEPVRVQDRGLPGIPPRSITRGAGFWEITTGATSWISGPPLTDTAATGLNILGVSKDLIIVGTGVNSSIHSTKREPAGFFQTETWWLPVFMLWKKAQQPWHSIQCQNLLKISWYEQSRRTLWALGVKGESENRAFIWNTCLSCEDVSEVSIVPPEGMVVALIGYLNYSLSYGTREPILPWNSITSFRTIFLGGWLMCWCWQSGPWCSVPMLPG